jgi:hypothetical protein
MAKISCCLWCFLLLCVSCNHSIPAPGVTPAEDSAKSKYSNDSLNSVVLEAPVLAQVTAQDLRENILQVSRKNIPIDITSVYLSQIGVREATGHNDGKDVEKYLRSVGLGKGYPWCAAFVHWCLDSARINNTINGAAASAHNSKDLVWYHKTQLKIPESGDVFTLWFNALGRIGHTGFFHRKINSTVYESVEGNTNEAGSREGDGVYKKYRSFNATYSISRWTKQ